MTTKEGGPVSGTKRAFGYALALILLVGGPVLFFSAKSVYPIDTAAAQANYSTRTETVVEKETAGRSSAYRLTLDDGTTVDTGFSCQNGVDVGDRATISTLAPYGETAGITTLGDCGAEALVSDVEGAFHSAYRDPGYTFFRLGGIALGLIGLMLALQIASAPEPTRTEIG